MLASARLGGSVAGPIRRMRIARCVAAQGRRNSSAVVVELSGSTMLQPGADTLGSRMPVLPMTGWRCRRNWICCSLVAQPVQETQRLIEGPIVRAPGDQHGQYGR